MRRRRLTPAAALTLFLAAVILASGGPGLAAQTPTTTETPDAPRTPPWAREREVRDPGTPSGAVRAYLHACRRSDWKAAVQLLDFSLLSQAPGSVVQEDLARQLKVVLDRTLPLQLELISNDPEGNLEDGLPPNLERLGTIGRTEILLERESSVESPWRFAASTVAAVPDLYATHGPGPLGKFLPAPLFEMVWLDLALWQWLGLLLVVLLMAPLAWIVEWILRGLAGRVVARTELPLEPTELRRLLAPTRGLAAVGLFALGTAPLALSLGTTRILNTLEIIAAVVMTVWLLLRVLDLASAVLERHWLREGDRAAIAVLPLARRATKVFLLGIGLVALLQNVGFNVTGLVTGLGLGGLAVALAAQKSIANLFGGISMVADHPVQVGDFCRFGPDKSGTIEEIGLRSTRIRTLDRTVITVPNADFSELQLENFGARDRIRFHTVIGLRYETSADQLRHLLTAMRQLLVAHPMVTPVPARVRFVGFGAHSLDVELFAFVDTMDWDVFLQVREDLLLRLMDLVAESGTGFAFPSQTIYLGRDGGLDETRTHEAEEQVRLWRERNELPFPNLSEDTIARLDDTVDYPPQGSPGAVTEPRS